MLHSIWDYCEVQCKVYKIYKHEITNKSQITISKSQKRSKTNCFACDEPFGRELRVERLRVEKLRVERLSRVEF